MAAFTAAAVPMSAQPNPFKPAKSGLKGAHVTYALTGDIAGNATLSIDGDRTARRQTSTMKMMGKTIATDTWTLTTADSTYSADLTKKQGTVAANILPHMARAYENLDGAGKKRFHENVREMASLLVRGFGAGSVAEAGEKTGKKSFAGQECEERTFGSFSFCTMNKAPIVLHSQGRLVCVNFEETATAADLSAPAGDAFAAPAGVAWTANRHLQNPDSMATGYVLYLSSQQLADSLASAKAQAAQTPAGGTGAQQTPEQRASMEQACQALLNFDMGKAMADATSQMGRQIADAMKRAAADAAKNAATSKLKGLFGKPKIP